MSITTSTNAIPSFSLLYFDISIKSTSHWSSMLKAINAFSWNIPKHLFVDCGFFDLRLYFLILYLLKTYFPSCLYKFSGPRNFQHWQDHSLSLLNNLPKTCWLFKSRRWNEETHGYSFFFYTIGLNELVRFLSEGWTKWLVHTFLRIFWSVKNSLFPPFYF